MYKYLKVNNAHLWMFIYYIYSMGYWEYWFPKGQLNSQLLSWGEVWASSPSHIPAWSMGAQATADGYSLPLPFRSHVRAQKPRQGTSTHKVGSASSSEFNFGVLIPMSSDQLRLGHTKTSKNQGKKEKLSKAILKESRTQNMDLTYFLNYFSIIFCWYFWCLIFSIEKLPKKHEIHFVKLYFSQ